MKLRRMLVMLLAMIVFIPGVMVFANIGRPTPVDQIHAGMFPVGSQQRVEYAHALHVRRGPFPTYAAFTHLTRGTVVTVLEYRAKWIRVNTPSGEGWIYAGYLSREMAAAPPLTSPPTGGGGGVIAGNRTPQHLLRADLFPVNSQATVDFASHVNIRRGPANSYAAFTHLTRGTSVTILEYRQMWVRLNTPSGEGWIFSGFLSNDAVVAARGGGGGGAATAGGLGSPTPFAQLRAENFPNGSQQTVDYAHFLNVRRGAGVSHAAFTYLSRGTVVTVLEFRNGWVRVNTDRGEGWISAAFLRR